MNRSLGIEQAIEILRRKYVLRPDEAAKILNCSRRTIYRLLSDGEIVGLKLRNSQFRIVSESVELYLQEQIRKFQEENGISDEIL